MASGSRTGASVRAGCPRQLCGGTSSYIQAHTIHVLGKFHILTHKYLHSWHTTNTVISYMTTPCPTLTHPHTRHCIAFVAQNSPVNVAWRCQHCNKAILMLFFSYHDLPFMWQSWTRWMNKGFLMWSDTKITEVIVIMNKISISSEVFTVVFTALATQ